MDKNDIKKLLQNGERLTLDANHAKGTPIFIEP